jgi:EthD domain
MVRLIGILTKKNGMSRNEFTNYYETRHVPLIRRIFPSLVGYSRNFVLPAGVIEGGHIEHTPPPPDFDVITSLWFSDEVGLESMTRAVNEDETRKAVIADEEQFLARDRSLTFRVDEHVTPAEALGRGTMTNDGPMTKMICMFTRHHGMSLNAFRDYYEGTHSVLGARQISVLAGYTRNYVIPRSELSVRGFANARRPDFDGFTELRFRSKADLDEMLASFMRPDLAKLFSEDEERLFDRSKLQRFLVDERITSFDRKSVA